ncbi:MAG: hypothetical protein AB7D43_06040 [Sulfurimonadaceae bacterium]
MAEKLVEVEALTVLRGADGKPVPIGKTCDVTEATAKILVKNKQAKLVQKES